MIPSKWVFKNITKLKDNQKWMLIDKGLYINKSEFRLLESNRIQYETNALYLAQEELSK